MEYSIIFHDLDGCLNPENGEDYGSGDNPHLSDAQCKTLKELGEAIDDSPLDHFVINTGRGIADTHFIAKKIISKKFRYCLLEHSGYGWDMQNDCKVDLNKMARDLGLESYPKKYEGMVKIHRLIDWFSVDGAKEYEKEFGLKFTFLEKDANLSILTPHNIHPETMIHDLKAFIDKQFPDNGFVYCYSHAYIDVLCDIHKSDGAKILCKFWNIEENKACIIGDGMNDLDIFSAFNGLMCPNNAHADLKDLCIRNGGYVSDYKYAKASFDLLKKLA
jgi:hydroxymethylpyrimidine pyrophosphatase-like HAD family hydrolase